MPPSGPSEEDFMKAFHIRIDDMDIAEANTHDYHCKCYMCLKWWRKYGPDPVTGKWGPFSEEEIKAAV